MTFGLGLLAMVVAAVTAVSQFGVPWRMGAGDRNHVLRADGAALYYQVHLPPHYDGVTRLPVMLAIHGCGMTGFGLNSMKDMTDFNRLADRDGFIVVYPTQRIFRDVFNCWRPADPREQHRRTGEPALLAGIARKVVADYRGDPAQVHVAGASSGAGSAVVLAATYPDVFATVASVAGGEYGLNQVDPADPEATPPTFTARQAWSQMGDRARRVPLLVVHGENDDVVPPLAADRLVAQWIALGDLVDDGALNDSLRLDRDARTMAAAPGGRTYERAVLLDPRGSTLVESYRIAGMGHAWPGPTGRGSFADRSGPAASALVWEFARSHPMSRPDR